MNKEKAIMALNQAINGSPNSCLSEHTRRLEEVREWLRYEHLAPSPPPEAPAPKLDEYYIEVTLGDTIIAANEDEAWEIAMDKIASRRGMSLVGHKITNDGPAPSFRSEAPESNGESRSDRVHQGTREKFKPGDVVRTTKGDRFKGEAAKQEKLVVTGYLKPWRTYAKVQCRKPDNTLAGYLEKNLVKV